MTSLSDDDLELILEDPSAKKEGGFELEVDLSHFENEHYDYLPFHFVMVIKAERRNMWYNPDTFEMITDNELRYRLIHHGDQNDRIEYADQSKHRIFGDVESYKNMLGPQLVQYSRELREQASAYALGLDVGYPVVSSLVKLFSNLGPDTIEAFSMANPTIVRHSTNREIWEQLLEMHDPDFNGKPIYLDIKTYYLERRRRSSKSSQMTQIVIEHDSYTDDFAAGKISKNIMEGHVLSLAEKYDLIDGDIMQMVSYYPLSKTQYEYKINQTADGIRVSLK